MSKDAKISTQERKEDLLKPNGCEQHETHEVSRFDNFVGFVTTRGRHTLFRGQMSEWPLIPSVGRDQHRSRFRENDRERETLEEFKRESVPYLDYQPVNDWQWFALAQHNGMPTRLLDWTTNPLVALWFAVKDTPKDRSPGIVWMLWYKEMEPIYETKDDEVSPLDMNSDSTRIYFPEHINPSIQAQSGVFTVHQRMENNTDEFRSLEEEEIGSSFVLKKITIPADAFPGMCYGLFRVGISRASLLPGLRGIAERIRYDNVFREDEKIPGHQQ